MAKLRRYASALTESAINAALIIALRETFRRLGFCLPQQFCRDDGSHKTSKFQEGLSFDK